MLWLIKFISLIVSLNLGPLWFIKRCHDKKEFDSLHPQGLKGKQPWAGGGRGGRGISHMKGAGILVEHFELNP